MTRVLVIAGPTASGKTAVALSLAERLGAPILHADSPQGWRGPDREAAARIRENDLVRVVRALEIAEGGPTQSALFAAHRFAADRYPFRLVALEVPREELRRRIDARVEAMFAGGILDEARALVARF